MRSADEVPWWRRGVIYQVLVPSYFDSNGDGIGDLPGVASKLEYLEWLGVEAVWLSPIFASPFKEMGYDPSDYTSVNPRFGTLEDFDALLDEAHRRKLRVVLDWVPNHTSSEHPWFQASRSSREDPQRDWYIWRDPRPDGSPPNNWLSIFGGSVWTLDEHTGQYFLHTFLEEQPDLNWWNRDVRQAVYDAMRFWLDRGVDGFRLDALDLLVKNPEYPDNPPNPDYNPDNDGPDMAVLPVHTRDQPGVHECVAEMRSLLDDYEERMLAGELYVSAEQIARFYGEERPELHLPLNPAFGLIPWNAEALHAAIDGYLCKTIDRGWPSWMISSHDGHRVASRAGAEQTRVAAMLLLTLGGTPVLYYGDEIGMHDVDVPPEQEKDPQGKRIGRRRDPARTPMQWSDEANAGFTSGEPWLPVADDYPQINVRTQSHDGTLLAFYRALLALRRDDDALSNGTCIMGERQGDLLSFRREGSERTLLVVLNLGADEQRYELQGGRVVLSTFLDRNGEETGPSVELRGNEGLILET